MKVFVVGTSGSFWRSDQHKYEQFKITCENIGAWLSKKHHVIIAGTVEPTADHWVGEGVRENFDQNVRKGQPNITLYAATDDKSHREKDNQLLKWLDLHKRVFTSTSRDYWPAHNRALEECDIVLVIGGNPGGEEEDYTLAICELAMRKRKPVIGLSHYGTHGSEMKDKTIWLYELAAGIPEKNLEILNKPLNDPNDEKALLKLLKLILKKNPLKQPSLTGRWIAFCIVLILILVTLWVLAFLLIPKTLEEYPLARISLTTLATSIIAGVFGAIWRLLIKKMLHLGPEDSPVDLGANIALAFVVGFTCGEFFAFFSWCLTPNVDQSYINYHNMAQETAIFSSLISILLTFGGAKAVRAVKDIFERLFSLRKM